MENEKTTKKHGFLRVIFKILAILLAMILLAALVLTIIPMTETVSPKTVDGSSDWMKDLDGSLRLNEIILPGAHDCASQYVQLAFITKCQALSVGELLDAGVRYLDIRLAIDQDENRLRLVHGFTKCRTGAMPWASSLFLEQVLDQCFSFLTEHPTETVIFVVKQENKKDSVKELELLLDAALRTRPELCLLTDSIPTLDEARGKLVLMRRYPDAAGLSASAGILLNWPEQDNDYDPSKHTELYEQDGFRLWVQDRFCYGTDDKWDAFLAGLACKEILPDDCVIHFLSTKGTFAYGHPYGHAKKLNQKLSELPQDQLNGWIILDFADAALCRHVWSANFSD